MCLSEHVSLRVGADPERHSRGAVVRHLLPAEVQVHAQKSAQHDRPHLDHLHAHRSAGKMWDKRSEDRERMMDR